LERQCEWWSGKRDEDHRVEVSRMLAKIESRVDLGDLLGTIPV
jgi:hypothetical protein